jgi:hypothetical protein
MSDNWEKLKTYHNSLNREELVGIISKAKFLYECHINDKFTNWGMCHILRRSILEHFGLPENKYLLSAKDIQMFIPDFNPEFFGLKLNKNPADFTFEKAGWWLPINKTNERLLMFDKLLEKYF